MRRFTGLLAALAIFGAIFASAAAAQDMGESLEASLNGANEVTEAGGDPDGAGTAQVTLDADGGEICYTLTVSDIDMVTAAHIHTGAAGSNGDVLVDFDFPTNGTSGCVDVDAATIEMIDADPASFYVNVHNMEFPMGAIRGQLAFATAPQLAVTGPNLTITLAAFGAVLLAGGALAVRSSRLYA